MGERALLCYDLTNNAFAIGSFTHMAESGRNIHGDIYCTPVLFDMEILPEPSVLNSADDEFTMIGLILPIIIVACVVVL